MVASNAPTQLRECDSANNDEDIVSAFDAIEIARYGDILGLTDQEEDIVTRAKRRIEVRRLFREALSIGYLRPIAEANDQVLYYDVGLTLEEQEQADLATRFVYMFNAHEKDDKSFVTAEEDRELLRVYNEIEGSPYKQYLQLTDYEQGRIERTKQRMEETKRLQDALKAGKPQITFDIYEAAPLLNEKHLNADEQAQLQLVKRYVKAFRAHGSANHPVVVGIYKEIAASPYIDRFFFTLQEMPGSSEITPDHEDIRPDGSTSPDAARPIVTIAGVPIYNRQFQRVYLVKQQYIRLRQGQWQRTPNSLDNVQRWILFQQGTLQDLQSLSEAEQQKISQQVLNDIVDDFLTQKEINSLPLAEKAKVKQQVYVLYEEFKQRDGFLYQDFLKTDQFTDDDVRETLAIFARREFLTDNLINRNQSIDAWLTLQRQKQNLVIQYAGQDTFEEGGDREARGNAIP